MDDDFRHISGQNSQTATEINTRSRIGRWIGEFIGTFFLVSFVKLTATTGEFYAGQYGIGFGLLVIVYQFGYISGAQFNPCVCIGLLCRGSLDDFPGYDYQNISMYLVAQLFGGILAGLHSWGLTNDTECSAVYPTVGDGYHDYQAFGAEFVFTFLLVYVIINVATSQQPNQFFGFCIGWTVFIAIGCIGHISGCSLNIAVWFGTITSASMCTSTADDITWKYAWIYIIADIGGAMCAGFLYRFLFIDRHQREQKFQKLVTEFLGTFFLVCLIKLSIGTDQTASVIQETIGIGLTVLVYLFGYIGGAHFNPSVTLGLYLTDDKFTGYDLINYICVQLLGGLLGGLFCYGIGGEKVGQIYVDYDHTRFSTSSAFFAELLFTFLLVNCILHVATSAIKDNQFYGLAIGSTLGSAVGSIGITGISGACLNLAVWFGTVFSALIAGLDWSDLKWSHIWVYMVAPFLGAAIAAVLYKYLYQDFDFDSETEYAGEKHKHGLRKYVAEFLGTMFLILVIKLSGSNLEIPYITPQISVGFVLISLIYQWGYLSQAHFNPAITVGVWLVGDIDGFPSDDAFNGLMYILMQLFGGFMGGLIAWGLGNEDACNVYPDIKDDKEDYQVLGAEFGFTWLLVLLLIMNVTATKGNNSYGISVGWMVMAAIGAIGSLDTVSGCCLNPAVWFGTIMSAAVCADDLGDVQFQYIWCYVIPELIAGVCAALFFKFIIKTEKQRKQRFQQYLAEFIGTAFLVSFIKLSISQSNKYGLFYPPISIGFGLCILVYCFGNISGAHFNPAVTVGVYCRGNVDGFKLKDYMNVIGYIAAQLLGGFIGGLYSWGIDYDAAAIYVHVPDTSHYGVDKAFAAEYGFTFLLVSSVIHCGVGQGDNDFYGMAIGFTLFAAANLIGPISGACLNPAVWFGTIMSATVSDTVDESSLKWDQTWLYLAGPFLGGITAGFLYKLLYYEPQPPGLNLNVQAASGSVDGSRTESDKNYRSHLMDSSPRLDGL